MLASLLTDENIENYLPLIPKELPGMELKSLHFIGVSDPVHPVGALVWKETRTKGIGELISIFVLPEYRGMGAGTALFHELKSEMQETGIETLNLSFSSGDKQLLTSFLIKQGCDLESVDIKKGYVYFDEAIQRLSETGISTKGLKKKLGVSLKKLSDSKKALVKNWIEDTLIIDSVPYFLDTSFSYVILNQNSVDGIILMLDVNGQIRLDYLYTKNASSPLMVASLLSQAAAGALDYYTDDEPLIEAVLQSESALAIWRKLFGEPAFSETYISGEYSPGKLVL